MPRVIDADGHVHETAALQQLIPFIDEPFRGRVRPAPDAPTRVLIDGEPWPQRAGPPPAATPPPVEELIVFGKEPLNGWHERPECAGMWDSGKRIPDMDLDGIDVAVLFPGIIGLAAYGHPETEMANALSRGYNDWLAGYCKPYRDRLKGVASLPIMDVAEAARELRRCVQDLGFVGGSLPNWPGVAARTLDDPVYYPLWEEAQRLDVPISIHNNTLHTLAFAHRYHGYLATKPSHDPTENMLGMQSLIFGGVLDRFPSLRFAFMEGGVGWIPFWIDRLGDYYEEFLGGKFQRGHPEEYFRSGQCYFSFEPEERTIAYVAETIGAEWLLYASDYLHHDAIFPGSVKAVRDRKDLSPEIKQKVLCDNAEALFRLTA